MTIDEAIAALSANPHVIMGEHGPARTGPLESPYLIQFRLDNGETDYAIFIAMDGDVDLSFYGFIGAESDMFYTRQSEPVPLEQSVNEFLEIVRAAYVRH